jgi:hypothetical protein
MHGVHRYTHLLVEFFVAFLSDGLLLLTTWEIMEVVPETVSGMALGLATACTSGISIYPFSLAILSQLLCFNFLQE